MLYLPSDIPGVLTTVTHLPYLSAGTRLLLSIWFFSASRPIGTKRTRKRRMHKFYHRTKRFFQRVITIGQRKHVWTGKGCDSRLEEKKRQRSSFFSLVYQRVKCKTLPSPFWIKELCLSVLPFERTRERPRRSKFRSRDAIFLLNAALKLKVFGIEMKTSSTGTRQPTASSQFSLG